MLQRVDTKTEQMTVSSNMYKQNRKSLNWFVGCRHECVYCKPSFQAQMKRQLHNCKSCYLYEPHAHLERLQKAPPKTRKGEFIFFPSSGDVAFSSFTEFNESIVFAEKWKNRDFLTQTKNTGCFLDRSFPDNMILGTTIETDLYEFNGTPSKFKEYRQISNAPLPYWRYMGMLEVEHKRKEVTIEPILQFSKILVRMIREIAPEFVYVGYDNHNCFLPEPRLKDTLKLIDKLKKFTEVRLKTLREAWWEN